MKLAAQYLDRHEFSSEASASANSTGKYAMYESWWIIIHVQHVDNDFEQRIVGRFEETLVGWLMLTVFAGFN